MTKTLKQILEETNLKAFQDIDEPTHYEKSWVKIKTLEAVKEWLTQKYPLYKGTSGEYLLDKLIEELNQ